MNTASIVKTIFRPLIVAFLLTLGLGGLGQAKEPGEQPIGWSKARVGNSPIKPLYSSEIGKDTQEIQAQVNEMAQAVKEAKVNPEADSVDQVLSGAISLERHNAEIAGIQDKFSRCMAAMSHQIQDAEASGKATRADRARFRDCMAHCDNIMKTLNDMHYNSSVMLTATKKIYFLNGWEKHKKLMARLQDEMKNCPMMMKDAMACCTTLTSGAQSPAKPEAAPKAGASTGKTGRKP